MTYAHSRPDFIELHVKTFEAFLQDEYEYVVFNDAPNNQMRKKIHQTCEKLGVRCFDVPPHASDRQNPSLRHCDGIRYSLKTIGFDYNGMVAMIDAEMLLVRRFRGAGYIKDYEFIGCHQVRAKGTIRVEYTAPCLVFMDMRTLPNKRTINFEVGHIKGLACDVGAHTYYYFKNNPTVKLKWYVSAPKNGLPQDAGSLHALGYDENSINLILTMDGKYGFEFHGNSYFIHYYTGGSNWPGYSQSWLNEKNRLLYQFINQQMSTYKNTTE